MSVLQAFFLGIVQGITEFLPVSSKGHLVLGQYFFNLGSPERLIFFDLICHVGTLGAILLVYAKEIRALFTSNRQRLVQIMIATLPLFPIVFLLKEVESLYDNIQYLGFFYFITAFLLFAGATWGHNKTAVQLKKQRWRDPALIGFFQLLALLPGVSRSGSTISGARLLGWNSQESVTFSFLIAIPAVLGGVVLKVLQMFMGEQNHIPLEIDHYVAGFISSFLVGYISLLLFIKLVSKGKLIYFAWYCLALGIGLTLYFNFPSSG